MQPKLSYRAVVPDQGFRWVGGAPPANPKVVSAVENPPTDWAQTDYLDFGISDEIVDSRMSNMSQLDRFQAIQNGLLPERIAPKYFVATRFIDSGKEAERLESKTGHFGRLIEEADLFLKFASVRLDPKGILAFANQYGFLMRDPLERMNADCHDWLEPGRQIDGGKSDSDPVLIEPATDWLGAQGRLRGSIKRWKSLASAPIAARRQFLESVSFGASAMLEVGMDKNGTPQAELVASSLLDVLQMQWAASVEEGVEHRKCLVCSTWFGVHPDSGRPEKTYCSDACKMRAYRERKKTTVSQTTQHKKNK